MLDKKKENIRKIAIIMLILAIAPVFVLINNEINKEKYKKVLDFTNVVPYQDVKYDIIKSFFDNINSDCYGMMVKVEGYYEKSDDGEDFLIVVDDANRRMLPIIVLDKQKEKIYNHEYLKMTGKVSFIEEDEKGIKRELTLKKMKEYEEDLFDNKNVYVLLKNYEVESKVEVNIMDYLTSYDFEDRLLPTYARGY